MINEAELLAAGYRRYPTHDRSEFCPYLYQKAIFGADGKTKLYFIAVKLWFFPEPAGKRHSAEVRFYGPKENQLVGETGFTLTLHLEKTATVSDVELFYAQAYKALSCVPDLHNQD